MIEYNNIEDVQKVTTMSYSSVKRLQDITQSLITNDVLEQHNNGDTMSKIDIGFGSIVIMCNVESNELQFSFIPSRGLEQSIKNSITSGRSAITEQIDQEVSSRILSTYKDLL